MPRRMGFLILAALVFATVFVSIASAHEVNIRNRAKIASGAELQEGTYQIEVVKNQDSADVRFFKDGDMVLQTTARLTKENEKIKFTEVHYDMVDGGHVITKIRLSGWTEALEFKPSTQ